PRASSRVARRAASAGPASPCTGRGLASRPCRHGRWWALTPPFHPYRSYDRRSPLCSTFRRLSPPGVSPASCPAVSGLSSDGRSGPRPPGLHAQCKPRNHANSRAWSLLESPTTPPSRRAAGRPPAPPVRRRAASGTPDRQGPPGGASRTRRSRGTRGSRRGRARGARGRASARMGGRGGSSRAPEHPHDLAEDLDVVGVDRLERRVLRLESHAAVAVAIEGLHRRLVRRLVVPHHRHTPVAAPRRAAPAV